MDLTEMLKNFEPSNAQEEKDKALIQTCLAQYDNLFVRENTLVHMTASSWITNPRKDKVVMIYHNLYDSWAWAGGHADGDVDLLAVALREAREETGLVHIQPLSTDIFSVEAIGVEPHIKKGEFVNAHIHLNVTYLLEADERDELYIKPDENSGVRWFGLEEAVAASRDAYMRTIYTKLNEKLRRFGRGN